MILNISSKTVVVFDLDDTLYKEIDYVKSAYRHISLILNKNIGKKIYDEMIDHFFNNKSTFDIIIEKYKLGITVEELVHEYRYHKPAIKLNQDSIKLLSYLKKEQIPMCLITDGRSKSQRNKINALGLNKYFEIMVISEESGFEKPNEYNFKIIMDSYPNYNYLYIADNFNKDFLAPNKLGWTTIGIKDHGANIHKQDLNLPCSYLPNFLIISFNELTFNLCQ